MRAVAVLLIVAWSAVAGAQGSESCGYAKCALGIAPRMTALDVVRGDAQARVGSLSFVWPRTSLTRAFEGDASATKLAHQSIRTRRVAAAFTDVGGLLVAAAATRAAVMHGDRRTSAGIAAIGAVAIGVSVPVQFAADGQLSRAVFEFNRRFAR